VAPAERTASERGSPRRVVLLGMMGAGKSTIGAALAERLGWRFVDLDAEIVRRAGRSVAEIFEALGEPAFRAREVEATRELAAERDVVIATGGGWVTNAGVLESVRADSLVVWLQAAPETALERARSSPDVRPLLNTSDPLVTIRALMRSRAPLYAAADLAVRTDGRGVASIISEIEARLRAR
jgi:shikimate kinase